LSYFSNFRCTSPGQMDTHVTILSETLTVNGI
jgi:hypothetical protein